MTGAPRPRLSGYSWELQFPECLAPAWTTFTRVFAAVLPCLPSRLPGPARDAGLLLPERVVQGLEVGPGIAREGLATPGCYSLG